VVECYTDLPDGTTVVCGDELGPVIPRTFEPGPEWTLDGHRVKAPLNYRRGPDKIWVYGGLRVADGPEVTLCASSRTSEGWTRSLGLLEDANRPAPSW
jgi:hypothetical protein